MFLEGLWVRWDKHHSKSVSIYAARANDAENDRLVKELTQLVEREMLVTSEIYACEFVDKVFNQTLVIQEDLQVRDENVIFVSIECYNANFYGDIKNGSFDGIIQCKPGMKDKALDILQRLNLQKGEFYFVIDGVVPDFSYYETPEKALTTAQTRHPDLKYEESEFLVTYKLIQEISAK